MIQLTYHALPFGALMGPSGWSASWRWVGSIIDTNVAPPESTNYMEKSMEPLRSISRPNTSVMRPRCAVYTTRMADISYALLAAFERGASIDQLADRLELPTEWVQERIEAAGLCLNPRFTCMEGVAGGGRFRSWAASDF